MSRKQKAIRFPFYLNRNGNCCENEAVSTAKMKSHSIEGKGQSSKGTLHPHSPSYLSCNLSMLIVFGGESLAVEIRLLSNIVEQDGARLVSIKINI